MSDDTYDPVIDISLDLETMSSDSDAAIVAIGAVSFKRDYGEPFHTFYRNVSLQSSIDLGLRVDGDTVMWWLQQSEKARARLADPVSVPIDSAINDLNNWLRETVCGWPRDWWTVSDTPELPIRIWGHGADFDPPILNHVYNRLRWEPLWPRRSVRDTRTLFDASGIADIKERLKAANRSSHDALEDARAQALLISEAWQRVRPTERISVGTFDAPDATLEIEKPRPSAYPSQIPTFECARCHSLGLPSTHTPLLYLRPHDGALMANCPSCGANTYIAQPEAYIPLAFAQGITRRGLDPK